MTDEIEQNDLNFIVRLEEKAFEALRKDGLSDEKIWDLMIEAVDYDWNENLDKRELFGLLLLEIHELLEKFEDDEFSQPAADWVAAGWIIMGIATRAGDVNMDAKLFSKRQSRNASRPRKKQSLINKVVDCVLDKLPPDDRGMTGFRDYIIRNRTLDLEYAKIDVNLLEDDREKVAHYVLDNRSIAEDDPKARKEVSIGTIASSISRYPERLKSRQAAD